MSFAAALLLLQTAWAPIPEGKGFSLPSAALGESRDIMVVEPWNYADTANYPVIVLLDGDGLLPVGAGMMTFLQKIGQTRGAILVGVRSNSPTDRYRIFTPTPDSATRARLPNSGGDSAMRNFLERELRPFIEQRWRTSDHWILAGHSLSALFAISTFAQHQSVFTGYIAISPVLGWQGGSSLRAAQQRVLQPRPRPVRLFLSTANEGERFPPAAVRTLDSMLTARRPLAIPWSYRHYANEDHGSTMVPALYDGLRFVLDVAPR